MSIDVTRRGFLAGLLGAAVIAVVPKSAITIAEVEPIDPWGIQAPPGITYQWVRCALLGEPDPANVEKRLGSGWVFVAPAKHPGAPISTAEKAIETCGLILMEKPTIQVAQTLALERAPRMDKDHRVQRAMSDGDIATADELANRLHAIGYTSLDVHLFFERHPWPASRSV